MSAALTEAPGTVTIGTRGSPLALAQSNLVRDALLAAHPGLAVEITVIKTRGDKVLDTPLAEIGGKGLFTEEIEDGLTAGRLDAAVHSMKDMPTVLPEGLDIPCILERADARDPLLAGGVGSLAALPQAARVGTSSLRRKAQLLALRPDLEVVAFRGNVATRIRKLADGEADATLLALAGLKRLGLAEAADAILGIDEMLPAAGQGAIGVECRSGDDRMRALLGPLDHGPSHAAVLAERAVVFVLEGSCRTPIAAHAVIDGDAMTLRAMIAAPDGSLRFDVLRSGPVEDAEALGHAAGAALKAEAGPDFLRAMAS